MPTLAATLSLNVPAITGLLFNTTSATVVNQLSSTAYGIGFNAFTSLTANSANWQSAYTTLSANSASWTYGIANLNTTLNLASGGWNLTTTTLSANSANWNSSYTTLTANSAGWNSITTTVNTNSGVWSNASSSTTTVASYSATWSNTATTVQQYSGAWDLSIIGSVTAKGPYTVVNTSTIIPISGLPAGYGGNYNVTLGGFNNTNSGCYNVLVGGNRNYLSGGCYNYIGTGGYNHIGGYNVSTLCNNLALNDFYNIGVSVLSGNGACTRIFDAQGGNFSSTASVGDTIGIAYTTVNPLSSVNSITAFTSGVVIAALPDNNSNCFGSITISGPDLSTCTVKGLNACALYLFNLSRNSSCIGSSVVGGNLNTASGNYSTVGGGSCNTALSGSTVAGGCYNYATNGSFVGGGIGNYNNIPYSVIAAGGFNKTGGCQTTNSVAISSNKSCTFIGFNNATAYTNYNFYDPVNIVVQGANGLPNATVTTSTVVGRVCVPGTACGNPYNSGIIVTGNLSAASNLWVADGNINTTGNFNTVGGGALNTASGRYSVVAGGCNNTALGCGSFIGGGAGNTASGNYTFVLGCNITGASPNTTYVNNLSSTCNINGVTVCGTTSVLSPTVCGTTSVISPTICGSIVCSTGNIISNGSALCINNTTGAGNTGLILQTPNHSYNIYANCSDSSLGIYDTTNSAQRVTIGSSGNVGIGGTSSCAQVGVVGAGQTTPNLNTTGALGGSLILGDTGTSAGNGGALYFAANGQSWNFAAIKGNVTNGSNNSQGDITFSTRTNLTDSTLTEKMRINASGNVGINTASPGATLTVAGAISASGSLSALNYPTYNYLAATQYGITSTQAIIGAINLLPNRVYIINFNIATLNSVSLTTNTISISTNANINLMSYDYILFANTGSATPATSGIQNGVYGPPWTTQQLISYKTNSQLYGHKITITIQTGSSPATIQLVPTVASGIISANSNSWYRVEMIA